MKTTNATELRALVVASIRRKQYGLTPPQVAQIATNVTQHLAALLDENTTLRHRAERASELADVWAKATCTCGGTSACIGCQYADRIAALDQPTTQDPT